MKNWIAAGVLAGGFILAASTPSIGTDDHCQDGAWGDVPARFVGDRVHTSDGWRTVTTNWCFEQRGGTSTLSGPGGATAGS